MATFKVIDIRRVPSAEPNRVGKLDYLVTYQLDPFRTYMLTIAADELTDQLLVEAVKKDLASMERFAGREFSL
jgi:hypothetical protein